MISIPSLHHVARMIIPATVTRSLNARRARSVQIECDDWLIDAELTSLHAYDQHSEVGKLLITIHGTPPPGCEWLPAAPAYVEICDIEVDAMWHRLGIGTRLFQEAVIRMSRLYDANTVLYSGLVQSGGETFWTRLGFTVDRGKMHASLKQFMDPYDIF